LKIGVVLLLAFAAVAIGAYRVSSPPVQATQEGKREQATEGQPFTAAAPVSSLAWSPDGHTLVTVSYRPRTKKGARVGNSTVQLWDVRTGKEKLSLGEIADTRLGDPTYSPDGKLLALSSFKWQGTRRLCEVQIYDPARGDLAREFESHQLGS